MIRQDDIVKVNLCRETDNIFRSNHFEMREADYQRLVEAAKEYQDATDHRRTCRNNHSHQSYEPWPGRTKGKIMKFKPEQKELEIWHVARDKWGLYSEQGMAVEELAETITAISHMSRGRQGSVNEFICELADAFVCSFQMVENYDLWDDFNAAVETSFEKLGAKIIANNPNYRIQT